MKQASDTFQVTRQNLVLRSISPEQLVRSNQPVTTIWQRVTNFRPQRFSFVIPQVPGSHLP